MGVTTTAIWCEVLFRGCLGLAGHPTRSSAAVAVPTGPHEVNNLNTLSEGLGGKHPIEAHSVSVTLPKPLSSDLWLGTSGSAMARGRRLTRRRRCERGI